MSLACNCLALRGLLNDWLFSEVQKTKDYFFYLGHLVLLVGLVNMQIRKLCHFVMRFPILPIAVTEVLDLLSDPCLFAILFKILCDCVPYLLHVSQPVKAFASLLVNKFLFTVRDCNFCPSTYIASIDCRNSATSFTDWGSVERINLLK